MNIRMREVIGAVIAALTISSAAQAETHCTPTSHVATSHYPGAASIPATNNLLLPAGKATPVEGQRLIITGHVLDSQCMPVTEAVVELWQVDPFGHWFLAQDGELVNPNPTFAGAGRTITDKDGQFNFITGFPGVSTATGKEKKTIHTPHVNLRIKATGFGPFTTVLFFQNDRRNAGDATYSQLTPEQKAGVTMAVAPGNQGDLNGAIDIILPGHTPYRTY